MHGMVSDPRQDQQRTIEALLKASGRRDDAVPIRRSFVQGGDQRRPIPGPAHRLMRNHDERGFELFLIHRLLASSDPWDVTRRNKVWSRALGLATPNDDGAAAISKTWGRLEDLGLVERRRKGRLTSITALHEFGDGSAYTYPAGGLSDLYVKRPFAYWASEEQWHRTLTFRAKVMLLIACTLKPGFVLTEERIPEWYGVSSDSGGRGLRELEHHGLLVRKPHRRRTSLLRTCRSASGAAPCRRRSPSAGEPSSGAD